MKLNVCCLALTLVLDSQAWTNPPPTVRGVSCRSSPQLTKNRNFFEGASLLASRTDRLTRVVTDIDDTVKSSGNIRLAGIPLGGIDGQYERGQFYPGVFQFAFELANESAERAHGNPLPVAVLTARAREFLFALELNERHPISLAYKRCGSENGLAGWGLGPILYGSVKEWVCSSQKGRRKFKNFKALMQHDDKLVGSRGLTTEYIFIGDTGEYDVDAGLRMCETFPGELRAIFLHVVSPFAVSCPPDYNVNGVPVIFFKTYVGAARKALTAGLLGEAAVRKVTATAIRDLEMTGEPKTSSKWLDLLVDIADAKDALKRRNPIMNIPVLSNIYAPLYS